MTQPVCIFKKTWNNNKTDLLLIYTAPHFEISHGGKAVLHAHNLRIILEIKCLITVDISEPIAGGAHLKSDIVYNTTRLQAWCQRL